MNELTNRRLFSTLLALLGAGNFLACGPKARPQMLPHQPQPQVPVLMARPELKALDAQRASLTIKVSESGHARISVWRQPSESNPQQWLELSRVVPVTKALRQQIELSSLLAGQTYRLFLQLESDQGLANLIEDPTLTLTMPVSEETLQLNPTPLEVRQGVYWNFHLDLPEAIRRVEIVKGPDWLEYQSRSQSLQALVPIAWQGDFSQEVVLDVHDRNGDRRRLAYQLFIKSDPLVRHAWHLQNRGQSSFAFLTGTMGFDARVDRVHQQDILGRGVMVRIVDTGLQIDHPDLAANVAKKGHKNYEISLAGGQGCQICDPDDPSPAFFLGAPGDQGTAVAGIIAAQGWNGVGTRGVAPKATLQGHNNFSRRFDFDDSTLSESLEYGADVVLFSHSRLTAPLEANLQIDGFFETQIEASVHTHRGEKGAIYIKAAGDLAVEGYDASFDPMNSLPWMMVVGSIHASGRKSTASLPGSSLWISAPGGEAGYQSEWQAMAEPKRREDFFPAVISTDMYSDEFKCEAGFAKFERAFLGLGDLRGPGLHSHGRSSGFNLGWQADNLDCAYAATIHGSAAASAVVAGVVALMLEANPELSWRDVRHILAVTARPIDELKNTEYMTIRGHRFPRVHAWSKNGGGINFHNWYGFGLIDAEAAVEMATSPQYQPLPGFMLTPWTLGGTGGSIPGNNPTGLSQSFSNMDSFRVEVAQVRLNLTHEDISHISIELVSPAGTRSILVPAKNGAYHRDYRNMVFASNAFYGESSRGTWTLSIVDAKAGRSSGSLGSWSIRFMGHYF